MTVFPQQLNNVGIIYTSMIEINLIIRELVSTL